MKNCITNRVAHNQSKKRMQANLDRNFAPGYHWQEHDWCSVCDTVRCQSVVKRMKANPASFSDYHREEHDFISANEIGLGCEGGCQPVDEPTSNKIVPPEEFEVKCINNIGYEEHFDDGISYMAKEHPGDKRFLIVLDRYAAPIECFRERFEVVKE